MSNLTILIEEVEKPHNLSAILRTCDAVGVLEAHAIFKQDKIPPKETIEKIYKSNPKTYGSAASLFGLDYRDPITVKFE